MPRSAAGAQLRWQWRSIELERTGALNKHSLRAQQIVAAPDGKGYWLVAKDGGVFAFGSARFYNSLPGLHHPAAAPVVGVATVPGAGVRGAIGPAGPAGPPGTGWATRPRLPDPWAVPGADR